MRALAFNARKLKNDNFIAETWFSNAVVRIKLETNSVPIKITHEKDLIDQFPNYCGFNFDMDFYRRIQEDEDMDKYDNLSGCWDGFDNTLDSDSASSSTTVVGYGEVTEVRDRIAKMTTGDVAGKSSLEAVVISESVGSTKGTQFVSVPPLGKASGKLENPRKTRSKSKSTADLGDS